jgi:hypothetical protein
MKKITLLLAVAITLANYHYVSASFSSNLLFTAKLTGDQETPPVGTAGYGVATFILNATRDTLCVSVMVRDLSSAITSAHIHLGNFGASGVSVFDLTPYITGNKIETRIASPLLTQQMIATLIARQYYINVNTANYIDGEIRGQIELETNFHLKGDLSGTEVVPAVTTPAIGLAAVNLHKDYMYVGLKIQVTGLSGPITSAQLHTGALGSNGPIVALLDSFVNGNSIVCEIGDSAFIYDLIAGNVYLIISTSAYPDGEVRAQLYLQSDFAFDVWLDASQEVPPTPSTSKGAGSITFSSTFDTVYYDVVFDSLTATPTAAHFHEGRPGESGAPVIDLTSSINGNHISGMASSIPSDFIAKCLLGNIYMNVHSATFPSGEIRGQVHRYAYEGFTFYIDATQEVPATGAPGTGSGFVAIDPEERSAHYRMVVNDLTGPLTQAHFHNAPPGVAGNVVFDLTPYFTAGATNVSASNYWTDFDFSTPFDTTFANMFMNNEMYVNFHTATNPDGEVRGNIMRGGSCFFTVGIAGLPAVADGWTIYPVPALTTATVLLDGIKNTQAEIQVMDMSGRIALSQRVFISAGENKINFDVSSLGSGIYGVRLVSENEYSAIGKLVKQ